MNLLAHNLLGIKPKAFGMEIENCSLKAFWLSKNRDGCRITSCARRTLPRGIVQAEQIIDSKRLVSELKELLASAQPKPIKTKYVVFSIPETKAFVRTIEIPKMSRKEAREAVKWETEANIPISVEKVYLDWQVVRVKENSQEVLVVAVPKGIVDSYYQTVTSAGLVPLAIEIDVIATIRSLTADAENKKPILIADIGAENTSLTICQNQVPYFTSSIPLSGKTFTEALEKELGVSWERAENVKFKYGLGKMAEADMLYRIFNPLIENLASEIERSIVFFSESINSQDKVEKIILSGGGSLLHEFPNYLSERLKREVVAGNPMLHINLGNFPYKISSRDLLSYATAIGLALRGVNYGN